MPREPRSPTSTRCGSRPTPAGPVPARRSSTPSSRGPPTAAPSGSPPRSPGATRRPRRSTPRAASATPAGASRSGTPRPSSRCSSAGSARARRAAERAARHGQGQWAATLATASAGVCAGLADGLGRLALLGLLGAGPEARETREAVGARAIDRRARDLEGDALDHRGAEDLGPARLLCGGLRRLFLVEDPPDRLEELLRDEAGEDAEDDSERFVEELHRVEAIRPGGVEFPPTCR